MNRFAPYLCILALAAFLLAPAPSPAQEVLTISTGEWAPWSGCELREKGAVLDIVRQAFARSGYEVRYEFYPWSRAFEVMEMGEVHASAYWYHRKKYEDIAYLSAPINVEEHVFVYRRDNPIRLWKTLKDLAGYRIGASKGLSYSDEFWRLAKEGVLNVQVVINDELNMKKLLEGRIDMFPVTRSMMEASLRNQFRDVSSLVALTGQSFRKSTGHLLFPRNRQESKMLVAKFNAGLKAIMDDGTLEIIMKRMQHGYYDPQPEGPGS
ncbi:substrate-binding periplasmic protein [Salidesulfovibrio onnuriiensis]|uniref:substrate-binding periplasmic protein n=1 Tax=Salidesulfovibrio onnuriiensis TaxID=2583823 RepID=UPI0011C7F124|nr:transporter substrate-binding domain-containing protein [Salidesulfovibrio onnuriiensis]